jgi:imidazolonepropionase-like amidohydrolase
MMFSLKRHKGCSVRRTAFGSALAVLFFLCPAAPAVAKPVAFVGGTIINGTGAASIPDGAIVVDDKKIVAVGRRSDVKIPADAQTSVSFLGARGLASPEDLQRRINALWEVNMGPKLLLMTPDEVRRETNLYLDRGVDFVKVAVSSHGISPESLMFSAAVLKAMGEEVHKRGKVFETHTATIESLRMAIEAGVDLVQHPEEQGSFTDPVDRQTFGERLVPDDLIALIKSRDILCSLLTVSQKRIDLIKQHVASGDPAYRGMNADMHQNRLVNLKRLVQAKVPFTMSTDNGPQAPELGARPMSPLIGRQHFDTMQDLVEGGMTPMEALVGATKRGAEACRRPDLGTLEAGKTADLIVLRADPLRDIANMRQIETVMKDGSIIDRSKLPEKPILHFDPEAEWPRATKAPTSTTRSNP